MALFWKTGRAEYASMHRFQRTFQMLTAAYESVDETRIAHPAQVFGFYAIKADGFNNAGFICRSTY